MSKKLPYIGERRYLVDSMELAKPPAAQEKAFAFLTSK
jgi:hypothetical protein